MKPKDKVLTCAVLLALASAAAAVAYKADQPAGTEKLRVLVLYESGSLTPEVSSVLGSKEVRQYMTTHGVEGINFLALDKDDDLTRLPAEWQELGKQRPKDIPGIALRAGRKGYVGPLPATIPEVLKLLQKYGGQ